MNKWVAMAEYEEVKAERDRLKALLNRPELQDFMKGVQIEAAHQKERWGADHDKVKRAEDWFWTLGYLAGKALRSLRDKDFDKALHHLVTSAALTANWFEAVRAQIPAEVPHG